jgi:hypothetical protein
MRRPLWLRLVIAVWAVWLGAMLAGPPELHACPVHGDHAAHQMSGADMAEMPAHAAHPAHNGAPSHQSGTHCTCVGACCGAVPVAAPAAQVAEISVDEAIAVVPVAPLREDRATTVAPPHSLPFANGPPSQA